MERAYVNLKREKGQIQEQTQALGNTHKQLMECFIDAKSLRGIDSRKVDHFCSVLLAVQNQIATLMQLQQYSHI